MGAVQKLCGDGIVLKDGRLVKMGFVDEAIRTYLDRKQVDSHYYGKADDRKKICFREISTRDKNGNPTDEFFHDEDIFIHYDLVFNIDKHSHDYNVFCIVLDQLKSRVFSAESSVVSEEKLILKVNREFLTRGYYSIYTFINKPQTEQIDSAEDVCSFKIVDNGSSFNVHGSYDYGRVFPNAEWIYKDTII